MRAFHKIKLPKSILFAIAAVFWISVWYLAAFGIGNELFLPYPHTVAVAFYRLIQQSFFWRAVWRTMLTVLEGCVIGCFLGGIFAVLASISQLFKAILSPLITVLRATPVASFIILVYVLVRINDLPVNTVALLIVIIMVIPIIYGNLFSGIASFDPSLSEVATIYRFSLRKKITVLWLPQAAPHLLSGVTNALGFAWKAGVAAEVICNLKDTVGKHLADSKSNLEMDLLFAWTLTVILLSMLFEVIFQKAFQKGGTRP